MRDLRKKALLESQKTVSRKARAKPEGSSHSSVQQSPSGSPGNSRAGSRANSRPSSRPGSRYASEDEGEDEGLSDDDEDVMTMSTNSVSDEEEESDNSWKQRLQDRVVELQDRKRSIQGRESTLTAYRHLLRHHVAQSQINRSVGDIVTSLVRSIRNGGSGEERRLALDALAITIITCPSDSVFGNVSSILRAACQDAEEENVKAQALHALGIAVIHGGGGVGDAEELLDFLLEIIESDGDYVGANDSGVVVTAALQVWGFVAGHLDGLLERSEQAMDAFMDQLDSADSEVQSEAGSNIALLFEAARDYEEETGEPYDMQYNKHRIMTRMAEIVKDSSKAVSRKRRKDRRTNFQSIVTSLERGIGPGYSTAERSTNPHTGGKKRDAPLREIGYQKKIRIMNNIMIIDTWLLHSRVEELKALLGSGLIAHYLENPVVREMLDSGKVMTVWGTKRERELGEGVTRRVD